MERLVQKRINYYLPKRMLQNNTHCNNECMERDIDCGDNCPVQNCFKKLAEYEDAEEQGQLVKLPFTFGDIIYEISENRTEIFEWTIKGFQIFEDATYICVNDYTWINVTKLGKTIFRTLDEARAKLKRNGGRQSW